MKSAFENFEMTNKEENKGEKDLGNPADILNNLSDLKNKQKLIQIKNQIEKLGLSTGIKKTKDDYSFWKTQPVPDMFEESSENKPIVDLKNKSSTPLALPSGFVWSDLDLNTEKDLDDLYTLLFENYVEDDDNMFRFDYSKEFLKWALMPPGWKNHWHCGIRVDKIGSLVGFIAAIPVNMRVYDKIVEMVEINFLCVIKKYRSKKMAPVLIREITRRVNYVGIYQAMYTSGTLLPRPVSECRYWHRPLKFQKLVDVKFSSVKRNMTMKGSIKLYSLPSDKPASTDTIVRPLSKNFSQSARKLLNTYLEKNFDIYPIFSKKDFDHWFLPREDVINSFMVVENKEVTDFCSFYSLPSTIMNHKDYSQLRAAYSFYNVATKLPLKVLMEHALIQAKNLGYDVFNTLDLMENSQFLSDLKFGVGDGNLHYYIYNWICPIVPKERLGLVLL